MESTQPLFAEDQSADATGSAGKIDKPKGAPRVLMPNREQMELRASGLDSVLPEGHRAHMVWGYVERQNLAELYAGIKVVEGGVGRTPIAPEILFALWLYATLEGIGSARAIARLALEHDAYRWICGGVQVNYHTVADFRRFNGEFLDELLTDNLAALLGAGWSSSRRWRKTACGCAPAPGRDRFGAKTSSRATWKRRGTGCKRSKRESMRPRPAKRVVSRRRASARPGEREARIEAALARLAELAKLKQRQGKKPEAARASTTDAEATVMKMGDGGFRPAYDVQFSTDTESQIIVGVDVVSAGSDQGQMAPMVEQVSTRCGHTPDEWLVDGAYPAHEQIEAVAERTTVLAPVPQSEHKAVDAHQPKVGDSPALAD